MNSKDYNGRYWRWYAVEIKDLAQPLGEARYTHLLPDDKDKAERAYYECLAHYRQFRVRLLRVGPPPEHVVMEVLNYKEPRA